MITDFKKSLLRFRNSFFEYVQVGENTSVIIVATVIGILTGFGAIGFRLLIDAFQHLAIQETGTNILERLNTIPWYMILLIPCAGIVIVSLIVHFFAREAKGHGVPEVMEAVALQGGRIRPRVVAVKTLASALTIATGGSVGREGPIVQIGSAISSSLGQFLRVPEERLRVLVGCGAAGGIAATFNAPVAGVMFAIEIILGNYAIATLTPLILSSVTATVICHAFPSITGGNIRAFAIPFEYRLVSAWEIPSFFLLGILSAFTALAFIVLLYKSEDLFDWIKLPVWIKAMAGGLLIGAMYLGMRHFPGHAHCWGIGYESIEMAMRGEMLWYVVLALVGLKLLATSISIGAGGSGGIFAPSLFLGAMTGGFFGMLLEDFYPASIPIMSGAYALVGMGAVVAGTTHAPITAILIIFELTGDYQIILPLMISCVIASLIASRLKQDSIYTQKLSRRGINLHLGVEASIMKATKVKDLMIRDVPTVSLKAQFRDVLNRMLEENIHELYAVDDDGCLKGVITLNDIKTVLNEVGLDEVLIAADLMETTVAMVTPENNMLECMNRFGASDSGELPVVSDTTSRKLEGIVTRRSVFLLYNREVLRQGTLGLKYISGTKEAERRDYVEIPENHSVDILGVSRKMAGQSLKELDLRKRFQINVVSIKNRRYDHRRPNSDIPNPDRKLKVTDTIVVVGPQPAIDNFKKEFGL